MGKLKTKYPVDVTIQFFLFLENTELIREYYIVRLDSGHLLFQHLHNKFEQFLINNDIKYQAYMFFQPLTVEEQNIVLLDWILNISEVQQRGRYIPIRVKSHTLYMKELIYQEIAMLTSRVDQIEQKISEIHPKEEVELKAMSPIPMLHHAISSVPILPDKDLDIGILFSQPIFDQKKLRAANPPVDFRSEIQRLRSALNNSYKPEITVQCQIGTKQHLKHLIGYKKPKILHIICHGTKDGELQFEDDSKYAIGALCTIDTYKIREILQSEKKSIPNLVFINSCHSEIIGKVFYEVGAKYVIMIDSQDMIDDEAAQIFSQNFYRNIFRGEKVGFSFKEAKDTVGIKHNSVGCCCFHTAREKHKPDCRWMAIKDQMGFQEAHRLYHIPSQKCTCEMRNHNRHKLTCEWARFTLFQINNDFRIKGANGTQYFPKIKSQLPAYLPFQKKELVICCCFNFEGVSKQPRIPHSECNKFKMLPADQQNTQSLYQLQKNVFFGTQVIDFSAPELTEYHQKVQNCSVMGRQQQLYEFMKKIRDQQLNIFFLYGHSGVGKTSFAIKTATYLIERRVYQIYFFIDLYDIKDRDMFRNKFNEVTKFGFPNNRSGLNDIRSKPMLIILDNSDEFFIQNLKDFQEQMDRLRKQFLQTKFIITCKEKNISALQNQPIISNNGCYVKELRVLDENTAAITLFAKIKNYLDISVQYMDIRGLIANKKQLQIPKVIENLSHSFSNLKTKLKLADLKAKIEQIGQGDFAFNKLVQQNLNILKAKCKQSYQMLIFISQFSQGVDKNDFNILSMYDKSQLSKQGSKYSHWEKIKIDIPVDKNWRKRLSVLFDKYRDQETSDITKDSQAEELQAHTASLQKHQTSFNSDKSQKLSKEIDDSEITFNQSYFLQQLSRSKFVVKRFIRDFIWNKDKSDENYYMKHIFVAYTAVMLDIYLKFLVDENYIHQQILEFSDISKAGIFKYKDNNYVKFSLTESIQYTNQYNSMFQMILKQQPTLNEKIKGSDPSVFIMNHKLDFLHIYAFDWSKVYEYLDKNRKRQVSILLNYLQKLVILIPTALKIANAEQSLIQYSIRQSIQLLAQIRQYSKPQKNLILTMKLKLMKAATGIQNKPKDNSIIPNTDFQRDFHKNDLQKISSDILRTVQEQYSNQIEIMIIFQQYLNSKQLKNSTELLLKAGADRVIQTIKKLQNWINSDDAWKNGDSCQILHAKRYLILSMIFFKVLELSPKYMTNLTILNFKTKHTITFINYANEASKTFLPNSMMKLGLRAKLIELSILWEASKLKIKQNQFSKEVQILRLKLRDIENIYQEKANNLIGLTYFDILIKKIKKEMKEKMWQQSVNSLIFMKAVPLSNKTNPKIQNIVRRKTTYKIQFQDMFKNAEIDLSMKFQILSIEKLQQESKKGSTMLLLNADTKIEMNTVIPKAKHTQVENKIYLILQGNDLKENQVEINEQFIKRCPIFNTKLLVIVGNNANIAIRKILHILQPTRNAPSMIAISSTSTEQFDEFEECNYEELLSHGGSQLRKIIEQNNKLMACELQITKYLIRGLVNPKNYQRSIKEIYLEMQSKLSQQLKKVKLQFYQTGKDIIRIAKGTFKDLSPGYRKAHNIDFQLKNSSNAVFRKWKQINDVFRQLSNNNKNSKYIRVIGGNGVGKTTFIQQIGRMCVQRGMFQSGLYIVDGKQIEEKHQSDFQAYILKKSQTNLMFNLQAFNKYANQNFMLIIDDFHLIKPRSNGRYNIFINRLLQKKINIILVTHQSFNIRDSIPSVAFKTIKIEKLTEIELNIYAYNYFGFDNNKLLQEYEEQKKTKKMTASEIRKIKDKTSNLAVLKQKSGESSLTDESLKRMISNRN